MRLPSAAPSPAAQLPADDDPDRVEAYWRRVLEQVPGDPEASFHLGNIARARGRLDEAIAWFETARRGAPDHGGVLNNLGLALEAAGRIDAAEPVFRQAVAAAPDGVRAARQSRPESLPAKALCRRAAVLRHADRAVSRRARGHLGEPQRLPVADGPARGGGSGLSQGVGARPRCGLAAARPRAQLHPAAALTRMRPAHSSAPSRSTPTTCSRKACRCAPH